MSSPLMKSMMVAAALGALSFLMRAISGLHAAYLGSAHTATRKWWRKGTTRARTAPSLARRFHLRLGASSMYQSWLSSS